MNRYARQEILPEVGGQGQEKLRRAHVLIVGAGGLGCPALQYLVGAGIGRITLIDPDSVDRSNLHRQPLYGERSLGQPKVLAARDALRDLNPETEIIPVVAALDPANATTPVGQADIAMDCADSFAASYILSDICHGLGKPLISASALGLSGYVGGFCGGAPSLRAVFPDLPKTLATCATAGVLGPVVGTLGVLQAQMVLGVLLGFEPSPLGNMVSVDLKRFSFRSFRFDHAPEPERIPFPFIAPAGLREDDLLVELRGADEAPQALRTDAMRAIVDEFQAASIVPPEGRRVVMCCRSGLRAWRAASALQRYWPGDIALIAAGDSN
ncbi:thiamine biosynthesis protein ThiF [Phyllobacterium phragmitis]|uniref:Thiamine biosynthesis protein ThiF n=1 Tax=Phyllobacterium phragmitis TaxID=2670329 RepID=A0A2S9ISE4_9HYPH|nr:HesA/MoeB/ThiF family protein [Phyllobacterium phragmitis]PRD43453.1 thiamine biosynthesis protein ThiF [Phyllobacterium phragmitis]